MEEIGHRHSLEFDTQGQRRFQKPFVKDCKVLLRPDRLLAVSEF